MSRSTAAGPKSFFPNENERVTLLNKFNSPVYLKDQKDKVIVTITENKSESGLLRFQILGKNQEPKIWKNLTLQFSSFPFDMTCFAVLCVKVILMNLPKH